jgi:PhoPQ-activated pathogenicity-related protein
MDWLGTPQLEALLGIEDPYSYRRRLVVPKLIVNATGDQFFTPDSSQFYFDGLVGEKHLRYIPNTDHSLNGVAVNAVHTGLAFVDSIIAATPRPKYDWQWDGDTIRVHTKTEPISVKLWQAENPHARDFRLQTIGRAFHNTELVALDNHAYVARISRPAHGFSASFVELTYAGLSDDVFTVTTSVRIKPDFLPFGPPRTR